MQNWHIRSIDACVADFKNCQGSGNDFFLQVAGRQGYQVKRVLTDAPGTPENTTQDVYEVAKGGRVEYLWISTQYRKHEYGGGGESVWTYELEKKDAVLFKSMQENSWHTYSDDSMDWHVGEKKTTEIFSDDPLAKKLYDSTEKIARGERLEEDEE